MCLGWDVVTQAGVVWCGGADYGAVLIVKVLTVGSLMDKMCVIPCERASDGPGAAVSVVRRMVRCTMLLRSQV